MHVIKILFYPVTLTILSIGAIIEAIMKYHNANNNRPLLGFEIFTSWICMIGSTILLGWRLWLLVSN